MAADLKPSTTETIEIDLLTNATGHHVWIMNNITERANYSDPILLLANQRNFSYPEDPQWNVYNFGSNKTVRIVMNNKYQSPHPMHLHGHSYVSALCSKHVYESQYLLTYSNHRRYCRKAMATGTVTRSQIHPTRYAVIPTCYAGTATL